MQERVKPSKAIEPDRTGSGDVGPCAIRSALVGNRNPLRLPADAYGEALDFLNVAYRPAFLKQGLTGLGVLDLVGRLQSIVTACGAPGTSTCAVVTPCPLAPASTTVLAPHGEFKIRKFIDISYDERAASYAVVL